MTQKWFIPNIFSFLPHNKSRYIIVTLKYTNIKLGNVRDLYFKNHHFKNCT